MNYPKNIKRNLFGIGAIEIRPYLTSFEIDAILQKAQESADSYAIRKAIIDASVLTLCTDLNDFKGEEVEKLFKMTKFNTDESISRFAKRLRKMGIDDKLAELGAEEGDQVRILDFYFEFK